MRILKKLLKCNVALCFVAVVFAVISAFNVNADTIASGTTGTSEWNIDEYGNLVIMEGTVYPTNYSWGWTEYADDITSVYVKDNVVVQDDASYMFANLVNVASIDVSGLVTEGVTDFTGMFCYDNSLIEIMGLDTLDTSSATDMTDMFYMCFYLDNIKGVENWDVSNVVYMIDMFSNCYALSDLSPLSDWDISSLESMAGMFSECFSLTTLDGLENWDTSNVTSFESLFCDDFLLYDVSAVSDWDVSSLDDTACMFYRCISIQIIDLSGWNTESLTGMRYMFGYCYSLETIYVGDDWTIENISTSGLFGISTGTEFVFQDCFLLVGGNGTEYDEDNVDYDYAVIDSDDEPGYLTHIDDYSSSASETSAATYKTTSSYTDEYDVTYTTLVYYLANGAEVEVVTADYTKDGSISIDSISVTYSDTAYVEVSFSTTKTLNDPSNTGRALKADEFTFYVADEDGNIVATSTNDEDGLITFTFKIYEAGTFTYTVYEKIDSDDHITYDSSVYTFYVTVTEDMLSSDEDNTFSVTYYTIGAYEDLSVTITYDADEENTVPSFDDVFGDEELAESFTSDNFLYWTDNDGNIYYEGDELTDAVTYMIAVYDIDTTFTVTYIYDNTTVELEYDADEENTVPSFDDVFGDEDLDVDSDNFLYWTDDDGNIYYEGDELPEDVQNLTAVFDETEEITVTYNFASADSVEYVYSSSDSITALSFDDVYSEYSDTVTFSYWRDENDNKYYEGDEISQSVSLTAYLVVTTYYWQYNSSTHVFLAETDFMPYHTVMTYDEVMNFDSVAKEKYPDDYALIDYFLYWIDDDGNIYYGGEIVTATLTNLYPVFDSSAFTSSEETDDTTDDSDASDETTDTSTESETSDDSTSASQSSSTSDESGVSGQESLTSDDVITSTEESIVWTDTSDEDETSSDDETDTTDSTSDDTTDTTSSLGLGIVEETTDVTN